MSKALPFVLITTSMFILTGCKDDKSESWYKEHPDETYQVYSQCLKDGEDSNNCEFSRRAAIMFAQIGKPGVKEKFVELFEQKEADREKFIQ